MDPFGPRLDRIERCYLHLSFTRESSNAFLKWFIDEFVTAVAKAKNLKYLLVRMAEHQKDSVLPLESLSGLRFAQVQLGSITHFVPPFRGKNGELRYFWGKDKSVYQQRLERLLMNDGRPKEEVLAALGHSYQFEPRLATDLTGEALREAQRRGGWGAEPWPDEYRFLEFLGISHRTSMYEELKYTTR
ncbi:MAG: hypothetical protein Q9198_011119 [Flavoplaca austrocitrina]